MQSIARAEPPENKPIEKAGATAGDGPAGAMWGTIRRHGLLDGTVVVSDDAGQFRVGNHALCWVHAERLVHKLLPVTEAQRRAVDLVRQLIWWFYRDLKAWQCQPDRRRAAALRARFERIFRRRTGYVTLDRLLARLRERKAELLRVLDRPEIPLHTNGSENDIRAHVTKRKIPGGTRSEAGRVARDVLLGLMKTCAKLGLSFFAYLGDRLGVPEAAAVLPLAPLVRASAPACSARDSAPVTPRGRNSAYPGRRPSHGCAGLGPVSFLADRGPGISGRPDGPMFGIWHRAGRERRFRLFWISIPDAGDFLTEQIASRQRRAASYAS